MKTQKEELKSIRIQAMNIAVSYFKTIDQKNDIKGAVQEVLKICKGNETDIEGFLYSNMTYEGAQKLLSDINEKESIRKAKGVYYTPRDVVDFIVRNSIRLSYGQLEENSISALDIGEIPVEDFCKNRIVFDPTCGAGEFLLVALEYKFDLWDRRSMSITISDVLDIVLTIKGNDINEESIMIASLRILLMVANRYGAQNCCGLAKVLARCFTTNDYVTNPPACNKAYDIVIGNPPYVEDGKSGLEITDKYGNIYANVLVNAAKNLKRNGVFGFIIPLSYISTPRMEKLRDALLETVPKQFILNYSDRPDCLFTSVHQKLSILICKASGDSPSIYTGSYQYWYKEERNVLFTSTEIINNEHMVPEYIPKLGNSYDASIYNKVICQHENLSLCDLPDGNLFSVYLNMRAAFWIKAFRNKHDGSEYKEFTFSNEGNADLYFCILNSSLFWWFWVSVSDCWHITKKELRAFKAPTAFDGQRIERLSRSLENKLEITKKYVGTVQTEYEYKHKSCVDEIHAIDDYINELYGLTPEESDYIKTFAFKYRISGGVTE